MRVNIYDIVVRHTATKLLFLGWSFTIQEVVFNYHQLTPAGWNNIPSASPYHDAREGKDVMINSHDNNPLDCLGVRLNVFSLLDDIFI